MTLEDITGVGGSVADDLRAAGFETVDDIASADRTTLEDVHGFGPARAMEVQENARELLDGGGTETTEEEKETVTEAVETDVESVTDEPTAVADTHGRTVTFELTPRQFDHLYGAASNEVIELQESNQVRTVDEFTDLLDQLRRTSFEATAGSTASIELDVTDVQLNGLHRSLQARFNEHRQPPFIAEIGDVIDQIDAVRTVASNTD